MASRSDLPLLCADNSEGAAPKGAPTPGDGPCSPGAKWVQGSRARPCSQGSHPKLIPVSFSRCTTAPAASALHSQVLLAPLAQR